MPQGQRTVTDEDILSLMNDSEDAAFTAAELAAELGMSDEGMRHRLRQLAERGKIESKKPSVRTLIWWPAGDYSDVAST
jgi:predicted ArsR family transcriptional regulator